MGQKGLLVACVIAAVGIAVGMVLLLNQAADPPAPPPSPRIEATATEPDRPTSRAVEARLPTSAREPPPATQRGTEMKPPHVPPTPKEVLSGNERQLNRPDGEYEMEPVTGNAAVKLSGKVKILKVPLVDNSGRLDASGLEAREIIFFGKIDGNAVVKLSAPGGAVRFNGPVEGSATLEVSAPNGNVTFVEPSARAVGKDGSKIDGGAKVTITAKDVNFRGDLRGGARVVVTLTRDGSLKFQEVGGGAWLHYKKADPGDPDPKLSAGAITEGGKVMRID
ncbi:MAG TPA: hypothetical protein VKA46_24055 [Gemmataceae bacterium]|nr:hypothetical protein [Gemmataceae bacterium]